MHCPNGCHEATPTMDTVASPPNFAMLICQRWLNIIRDGLNGITDNISLTFHPEQQDFQTRTGISRALNRQKDY